jgi:hypothetical protein
MNPSSTLAGYALERANWCIDKSAPRYMISGLCISTDRPIDGVVLDVAKHYVPPTVMPIPLLVHHDYCLATGLVKRLIPSGNALAFEAEVFNADSREWAVSPLAAILQGDLVGASVKVAPCARSYGGFTIEEVSLTDAPRDAGAAIDHVWRVEPYLRTTPGFTMTSTIWESERKKKGREQEKLRRLEAELARTRRELAQARGEK